MTMWIVLALCGLSTLASATLAQFYSYEKFDEVLLPILTQCEIHILSHRCVGNDSLFLSFRFNKVDQELEEAVLIKLISRGLPYRYTILPCHVPLLTLFQQTLQIGKDRSCQTYIWLLEPYRSDRKQFFDIRFSWFGFNLNFETYQDFVLLMFREGEEEEENFLSLDMYNVLLPENVLLIALNPVSLFVKRMGMIHRHCDQRGIGCVQWMKPFHSHSVTPVTETESNKYFCNFAPRSVYSTCLIRNLNGIPLLLGWGLVTDEVFHLLLELARRAGLREILVGTKTEFHRNKNFRTKLLPSGIIPKAFVYYQLVTAVDLYEDHFNVSIRQYKQSSGSDLGYFNFPYIIKSMELRKDDTYSTERYVVGSGRYYIMCVKKLKNEIDLTSILNPLDKWIWVGFSFSYLVLGVVLRKYSRSSFFILLAPVFTQNSQLNVKWFSYLVLIWTFICLLMSNLYASFIGSFLIVPPPIQELQDFEELYKNGYKLFFPIQNGESESQVKKTFVEILTGGSYNDSLAVHKEYKYLFKLQENAGFLSKLTHDDALDRLVEHGRGCSVDAEISGQKLFVTMANAYPGYVGALLKQKLAKARENWRIQGPYRPVLQRGLSLFFAAGITQVFQSGRDLALYSSMKIDMENLMQRSNPYYRAGVFYQVGEQESLYLFTLKNEQSRLVFYLWASLVVMTSILFFIANRKKITRVLRKYTKRTKKVSNSTGVTVKQQENEKELPKPALKTA